MWGVLTKIFTKNNTKDGDEAQLDGGDGVAPVQQPPSSSAMDNSKQAKQRASVKWLLSKAFNNNVPENLREPFYKDHENQEHLKPQIAGALANAEIYCLALGNIYSDPNYHNLNHWAILQTLTRKGVFVQEPSDAQLTETTLIQTNPLRLSAHMAVIESIMILYAKEVVTADRVWAAVQRFTHGRATPNAAPPAEHHENCLFVWISSACEALQKRIESEAAGVINGGSSGDRVKPPEILPVKELKDLMDGVALAALIAFYCPDELPWTEIKVSYVPSVQDSLHNLRLVQEFCNRCLPVSIFHIQPEDVTYMRDTMRQNLIVFLADLFNVVEIHPAKCVRYPGMDRFNEGFAPRNEHGVAHKRNLLQTVMTPIPDLRSGIDSDAGSASSGGGASAQTFQVSRSTPTHVPLRKANSLLSEMSDDSLMRRNPAEESFVVHRGKNIPTLRSIVHQEQDHGNNRGYSANKEKYNNGNNSYAGGNNSYAGGNNSYAGGNNSYAGGNGGNPEKTEILGVAAGKPSNWEESKRPTFAGRRSRRNSTSDDSQLTIENFGGSQDNLNFIGRNPDKEVAVHIGRKISAPEFPQPIENPAVRSSLKDARGSIQLGYGDDDAENDKNGCEKERKDREESEKYKMKRQLSNDDISLKNIFANKENLIKEMVDGEMHGKRMSMFGDFKPKLPDPGNNVQLVYMQHNTSNGENTLNDNKKTTTWQQQSSNSQQIPHNAGDSNSSHQVNVNPVQLSDVRLKLEEKRRMIENEKRRMELAMNKQRQKVGKAAFLQAVAKGRGSLLKTSESDSNIAKTSKSTGDVPPAKSQRPFTLKEITDDAIAVERKWLEGGQYVEVLKTPDLENMDLEHYQQSIAQMNSSLNDIQTDIQRLASQQSQIQAAQQQNLIAQQQKQIQVLQQQQQYQSMQPTQPQQPQPSLYNPQIYQQQAHPMYHQPPVVGLQSSASAPHIPQSYHHHPPNHHVHHPQSRSAENQFFLHDHPQQPQQLPQQPQVPQRRTWAQQQQQWAAARPGGGGFVLHDTPPAVVAPSSEYHRYVDGGGAPRYQNGNDSTASNNSFTLSQQHHQHSNLGTPSASPQHRNIHRQISQLLDESKQNQRSPVSLQQLKAPTAAPTHHSAIPAPPVDDMEPQSVSFIGNSDEMAPPHQGFSRLNITSGSRTYRIPSPTRPILLRNSFQPSLTSASPPLEREAPIGQVSQSVANDEDEVKSKKGFYIEFENEPPKRPKPPLRTKRGSPRKERDEDETKFDIAASPHPVIQPRQPVLQPRQPVVQPRQPVRQQQEETSHQNSNGNDRAKNADAIIIENESGDPDLAERARRRILLNSLQRRQQQEEAKARKEMETQARREAEKAKEEEKLRKKEEQAARRAAILEQYKMKKAMDEAEREGKVFDRSETMGSLKPTPKMRPKGPARPRPKTIHIDSGSVEMAEGMMGASRGKKGSTSNLTANSSTMKRDYYRGSQDSLTDRSLLYRDSPDDSRGVSPCHSTNQTLGRRSSYKTSRDPSPAAQVRGRPKYTSNYQNFKGRKSSSLMNLYGSSTDQDSLAYRYGETDSGLGRATPPRRAPSPGMGSLRHLPSPSGPGSLPGFMCKNRRIFDDGSSDISSTPSSMMDYNGPRLYKQPATKSNRGIMLNAVEYCVFPGVVNREAKKRVLEEINRSESKHFLILFRDAGCQFRALYSYCPDREEVTKLYGTGPKQVNDRMFDKFFKYNSGGKCFSQVHTKHLTVTIDAFTIHNSLWQGKKVNLPSKKDMALVI